MHGCEAFSGCTWSSDLKLLIFSPRPREGQADIPAPDYLSSSLEGVSFCTGSW